MLFLIDQDGPLADFEKGFLDTWQSQYPDQFYIPLAERKLMYLREEYPSHLTAQVDAVYCNPGFYHQLPVTAGAIEAINQMLQSGIDVRICTSPLSRYENCVLEKYRWVEKHLGRAFTQRMIVTKDKTMVRGDILIDDKPVIDGVYQPEWQHILFDEPYNRNIAEKKRLNWQNWREVLADYLK